MPNIDPFGQNPAVNGLDAFSAYWACALADVAYTDDQTEKNALYAAAGGAAPTSHELPGRPIPRFDYSVFGAGRAVVTVTGTRFFLEFVNQLLGVALADFPQWPGEVGIYWAGVAIELFELLSPLLADDSISDVAFVGHSQGGGIVQLWPALFSAGGSVTVANLTTLGSPRTGNVEYANAQNANYVRLTNAGDPVPQIPAAVSTPLDQFLWLVPGINLGSYSHWGTRFHLFADGRHTMPPELPSWQRGWEAMITLSQQTSAWFRDHRPAEYARRLRVNLPGEIGATNPNYPGLKTIDDYFADQPIEPPAVDWFQPPTCG